MTTPKERKLRLMQIVQDLDLGGLQQVVFNLCRTIDRSKFDVSVLCLRDKGRYAEDIEALNIPVYLLEQKPDGTDYFGFLKVAELLKEKCIDVIHTHNTQAFFDGTLGALIARVPTIVHTDHARSFPDKTRYMIAEWLMSHFAYKVVGCSEHTSQQLIKYEKISPRKIATIPNGIDPSRFEITIDKDSKRRELGIRKCGPVIGLAVRLSDQKGVTYLLNAMPQILSHHPETTLLIAGEGELKADLQHEADTLNIAEHVIFCGARKDIPELLKLLDIYVLPSKWEGLPMVILEAMASGCPVVATDVGGNASAVIHAQTGILIPPQDANALSNAIIELLDSAQLRTQYARSARTLFDEKFSAQIMARQYEKLYLRQH